MGRYAAWPAVLSALVLSVAGCGNPNKGDQLAEEFDAWVVEHPVRGARAETRGDNVLPYSGSLTVTLHLTGTVTAESMRTAVSDACAFAGGEGE